MTREPRTLLSLNTIRPGDLLVWALTRHVQNERRNRCCSMFLVLESLKCYPGSPNNFLPCLQIREEWDDVETSTGEVWYLWVDNVEQLLFYHVPKRNWKATLDVYREGELIYTLAGQGDLW